MLHWSICLYTKASIPLRFIDVLFALRHLDSASLHLGRGHSSNARKDTKKQPLACEHAEADIFVSFLALGSKLSRSLFDNGSNTA